MSESPRADPPTQAPAIMQLYVNGQWVASTDVPRDDRWRYPCRMAPKFVVRVEAK